MALVYRIYAGVNGPVDYSAPLVTTAALAAAVPALAPGDVATYVLKAFDTVSGLEDTATDARVTVKVGGDGSDVTGRPAAPVGLTVRATAGGTARVTWGYPPRGGAAGFRVYVGTPGPDYSAPAVAVGYGAGTAPSATLSGLADGVTYRVAVRAFNAAGEEQNAATARVTGRTVGPLPPTPVSGFAVP